MERENVMIECLAGGSTPGVVRIGDVVHRPQSSNATFVHALLRHLEQVGFSAAPRFRGIDDQGRERLTYIDGTVLHNVNDVRWTDGQLRQVAILLRTFHDATAGSPLAGDQEVVCHNDVAPWNVVLIDGEPTALIDFDEAAPGSRLRDVSYAVWCWLNLGDIGISLAEQTRRIRLFCCEYGLVQRGPLIAEIIERQGEIHAMRMAKGHYELAARVAHQRAWLQRHVAEFDP
jgi:Ser/Thr protein kinase RdoA (MazF antagonist)